MTATETTTQTPPSAGAGKPSSRTRALLFGTGFGIAVAGRNLELAIVRVRPAGPQVIAAGTVNDFRSRPAAEWGAEVSRFLASAGETKRAATLLLPRGEIIVRTVNLPGVEGRDVAAALALQIDTLHPYGDGEAAWAWSPAASFPSSKGHVLVGLARPDLLRSYETLFAEAGIPLAAVTFSSAAIHSSLRLWGPRGSSLLAYHLLEDDRAEIYGESEARPVYSAELPLPLERALGVARAELRLPPETAAAPVAEVLPEPSRQTDLLPHPFAYAAAMAGAAPRTAKLANLLPDDRRATHGRLQYVVPLVLALLLLIGAVVVYVVLPALDRQRYVRDLENEARKLQPVARRVQTLDAQTASARANIAALDQFALRPAADLDVLNELTRLLPAQVWTSSLEIFPDSVTIVGEAEQAAPLLKLLDSSPLFQNSEFGVSVTRQGALEQFRIRTLRRGRIGRSTP